MSTPSSASNSSTGQPAWNNPKTVKPSEVVDNSGDNKEKVSNQTSNQSINESGVSKRDANRGLTDPPAGKQTTLSTRATSAIASGQPNVDPTRRQTRPLREESGLSLPLSPAVTGDESELVVAVKADHAQIRRLMDAILSGEMNGLAVNSLGHALSAHLATVDDVLVPAYKSAGLMASSDRSRHSRNLELFHHVHAMMKPGHNHDAHALQSVLRETEAWLKEQDMKLLPALSKTLNHSHMQQLTQDYMNARGIHTKEESGEVVDNTQGPTVGQFGEKAPKQKTLVSKL